MLIGMLLVVSSGPAFAVDEHKKEVRDKISWNTTELKNPARRSKSVPWPLAWLAYETPGCCPASRK